MKITMFLFTCLLLQVNASSYAQRISINRQHCTIHTVLEDIRKQAKYDFFYDTDLFSKAKPVSIQVSDATVAQVLDALFKRLPYSYTIDNKWVVITAATKPGTMDAAQETPRQRPGRIAGKIIDDRGAPLPGASVKIIQTRQAALSGIDGSYNFNIVPGSYTIEVSYISFQTRQITQVDVKAGQLTRLNIALKASSSTLSQVVVTGTFKKESVAGLYAAQKNAASVTDGISAEQISRAPDNDMGQVLKRVTGLTTVNNRNVIVRGMSDRYNQAMLDGVVIPSTSQNRRDFSFDIIPTEMVSAVVVNKTATPDVSAEFSGGQVSVITIDIPEKNFTSVQYGIGGNTQAVGKDFYRLGERHTSEYFGFFNDAAKMPEGMKTWQWSTRAMLLDAPPGYNLTDPELNSQPLNPTEYGNDVKYNDLDAIAQSRKLNAASLKPYTYKVRPNQNMRLSVGRVYDLKKGNRFGFAVSANIRSEQNIVPFNNTRNSTKGNYMDSTGIGDKGAGTSYRFNSNMGLVANMGWQGRKFRIALKNMYARTYSDHYNESIRKPHDDSNPIANRLMYQLPEAMSLQQQQLTGSWQLPWKIKAEGMFTVNKIQQQILDERKLSYQLTSVVGGKPYFQTPSLMTNSAASVRGSVKDWRMWTSIDETDYNWSAAFSRKFGEGKKVSTLMKFGYQAWSKQRSLDVFKFIPFTRSWVEGTTNQPAPAIEISYDQLLSGNNIGNGNGQAYYSADVLGGRYYDGKMGSHALYLMADQQFWGKLRLAYGVRAEYFDLNSRQEEIYKRATEKQELDPDDQFRHRFGVKESNWRFLPSINATYSLTPDLNIRSSYSRTIIRPDFREVGMFAMYDFEIDGYVYGEHVQSTQIDNMDVRVEWYPSPGEIISITGFYKKLDKPIELIHSGGSEYTFANMENAKNIGLEMEIRKNFSFISDKDWLKQLFVYANGTLLKSEVNVLSHWQWINDPVTQKAERVQMRYPNQDRPLIGQSPWLLNLGVGYWGNNVGATVSYNHRGYRTNLANVELARVEYELAPRQLDAQVYARFFKRKLEVKLNLANLLDEYTRFYMNIHDYVQDDTKFSVLKEGRSIKYHKEDGDIITYRRKEGRRFSLSFSYNF
ncbi:TonB-dependent receptor domain-containing protein [Chitinophaga sp. GCM10012297]|uniref:TonB-dependent receptor n=1 Tax=Chitinophaga chungangae TaxID=2821488 RepID=A0ABS3YFS0_9BACT|nr:TonB-dependent receptor [Chitinophaga chungangae]MBO9153527.1 TonB-dependent receptor [Chitinophaga chungangae]